MTDSKPIFFQIFFSIKELYQTCRNLSLDVVLGALVMNVWIAKCLQVSLQWQNYAVLGLTVWLIYTLDHLLDAKRLISRAHTARHLFHQQYAKILWLLGGFVLIINAYLTLFGLDKMVLFNGCWVLGFTIIHFLLGQIESLHHHLFFQKEVRIAWVYVLGVGIAPFSLAEEGNLGRCLEIGLQVFLYAWMNLSIISWYELEIDQADGHSSLAIQLGREKLGQFIWIGLGVLILLNGYAFYLFLNFQDMLVLGMMTTIVGTVWLFKKPFKANEGYRILLDGIFFLPLIRFL